MFFIYKKFFTISLLVFLFFSSFAGASEIVHEEGKLRVIKIPVPLDEDHITTKPFLKYIKKMHKRNVIKFVQDEELERCSSNAFLDKVLSGFHKNIKKVYNKHLDKEGIIVYSFTDKKDYKKEDLTFLICEW